MGFSENLENNLKSLEAQEERDPAALERERARREQDKERQRAAAPYVEQLRNGAFTQGLLAQATRIGFGKRTKVHIVWLETPAMALRLDARNLRLELRPVADGVEAHYFTDGVETGQEKVDLDGDPAALAGGWLAKLV
jgi:sRNA-binding protein